MRSCDETMLTIRSMEHESAENKRGNHEKEKWVKKWVEFA